MIKNKICYIDQDGVLVDFNAELYRIMPELIKMPESKERKKIVDNIIEVEYPHFFLNLKPIEGAIQATAPWKNVYSLTDKRIWCEKHLGKSCYKKLILSHNKGLLKGDYLIDDRIKNGVENFEGKHIHFGQKGFENWNKVIKCLSIIDGWDY